MTNLLQSAFNSGHPVLSVYFTAGHPQAGSAVRIIQALQDNGVDMIEIGMPFSDPLADGPTIQHSSEVALRNGMNMNVLFEELKGIREKVTIPLVMMGYLNPVLQYGVEKFCQRCADIGINGLIIPDLPLDEFTQHYKASFDKYNLEFICLITPQTSENRIREIDEKTGGFIYMVAAASTTGAKGGISDEQITYFERIKEMKLKHPRLIGFGISNKATYELASSYSGGVIIGSAFIKAIEGSNDIEGDVQRFVKGIR
ncbi:MAG: tryptophan synthase subunit alpha [Flavobacteriales bacterium]|nr:tryptophan synthase subunit alpha [Flavobacteriales bacterium]